MFIYAPLGYRINNIMKNYGDTLEDAKKHIEYSDKSRSKYYSVIANKNWGDKINYDLCLNPSIGNEETAKIIVEYVKKINKK